MAKIKTITSKKELIKKDEFSFMQWLTSAWILAMLAFMPIYTHNAYGDVLTTKYAVCLIADGILIAGFVIWALVAGRPAKYLKQMKSYADPETGKWFWNWFKASFSILDIFMLAFLLIVIISTLQASPYMYQAFFGNEGRWHGALIFILYAVTYFIISRYYKFHKWHIVLFMLVFLFMCVWAITDYFMLDIYNFKVGIAEEHYSIFVSSIGNIDTFTAVAMIPFAFAGTVFLMNEETPWKNVFYWVCSFVSMISMITSSADNAYLSFAAFFIFVPFFAFKTRHGIRRYLVMLASFVTALQLVVTWNTKYAGDVVTATGVVSVLEKIPQLKYVMIALWIVVILVYIYDLVIKKVSITTPAPKIFRMIWLIIVIAGFGGLIALLVMANKAEPYIPAVLEPAREYLELTDSWGMWRMLVWKKMMELYQNFPFIHKIFGSGPETAGIYIYNNFFEELAKETGQMYDSPHNELFQMLFNLGPLGLISYLGIYISPTIMSTQKRQKKWYPVIVAIAMVCICHLAECWVNIMVPMDIPVLFALLAVAGNLYHRHVGEVQYK
ncbi:MAG: O-antigen ligase family protein [Lachnospiraceae bacterium]|nr:O-antigen ligase family protein [Candidatus Darwinimomas equi]